MQLVLLPVLLVLTSLLGARLPLEEPGAGIGGNVRTRRPGEKAVHGAGLLDALLGAGTDASVGADAVLVPMLPLTLTRMPTLTAPFPAQVRAIQSRAGLVAALMKSATCGCLDALWSEVAPDGAAGAKVEEGEEEGGFELLQLHLIVRHGDRSPVTTVAPAAFWQRKLPQVHN